MTIRRGAEWGESIDRPADLLVASSDSEFVRLVEQGGGEAVTVSDGDLHRALGAPKPRRAMRRLPLDLIEVHLDGEPTRAVSHVLLYRSWWHGDVIVVSNVGLIGARNVAPRAHPNDGKLDVVEVPTSFGIRRRAQAYRRLPTGTHVPHPAISYRQVESAEWSFDRPIRVRIDGRAVGSATQIRVGVLADAVDVII